jgi:hypothetical protein
MPSFHDVPQGDMYIEYSVVMPTAITTETRESEFMVLKTFPSFLLPLLDHVLSTLLTLTCHLLARPESKGKK